MWDLNLCEKSKRYCYKVTGDVYLLQGNGSGRKKMAKTAAERQAAYRAKRHERNNGDGEALLHVLIKSQADFALERLARHHKLTKKAMIEQMAIEADEVMIKTLGDIETPEWKDYFALPSNKKKKVEGEDQTKFEF